MKGEKLFGKLYNERIYPSTCVIDKDKDCEYSSAKEYWIENTL